MGMVIFGVILFVIAAVLLIFAIKMNGKILELRSTKVSPVSDLLSTYAEVAKDLGDMENKALENVAVYGDTESENPLISPLSQQKCVYYDYKEEYEVEKKEQYEEKDSNGNTVKKTRTVREYRTASTDNKYIEFFVNDGTGKIKINPESLNYDLTHNEKVQTVPYQQQLTVGSFFNSLVGGEKIIGIRKTERVIPIGFKVFVAGGITPTNTGLIIAKHQDKAKQFILADRSQDTLINDLKKRQLFMYIGSGVLDVVGIILIIVGIVGGKK